MKILIYTHAFAPMVGGVETLVMSLAKGLSGLGTANGREQHDVRVVTPTPCGSYDDARLPFLVVREPGLSQLAKLIRTTDVLHLAGPCFVPMLLGLVFGKPVVVEHSLYQAICPNGLLLDERTQTVCPGHFMAGRYGECLRCNAANVSWVKSLAMLLLTFPRRWMCGRAARNIGPTDHVSRRVALSRTVTIHHGVAQPKDAPRFGETHLTAPLCFAYVGRLVSKKGLELLVEATRRLHAAGCSFRLRFVGDGPDRSRLEKTVDTLGLRPRVTFTGFLQDENLENALRDVAVVVMPSIWEETAGLSAMEHMMRGRTVIATDIGGLGEMIGDAGLTFPLGDVEGLTTCMKRVIDEPSLAAALGEKAWMRAQEVFPEERMLAEHLSLYCGLLGRSGRTPMGKGDGR